MKLSVCIPVYNFDVNDLVLNLHSQIISGSLDAEIIVIDDCSEEKYIELNKDLETIVSKFIFLDKNIGRSKIRNLFLNYTDSEYLLFLDCDGEIIKNDFIRHYLDFIENQNPDVIYGGRKVDNSEPNPEFRLRWKFAIERENLPVETRQKLPYLDFQTNNFIVKKSVLKQIPFNEKIKQYGYEDLIFAQDLCQANIKIYHIENPVLNVDIETNAVFLDKADQSAKSLADLIIAEENVVKNSNIKLAKAYFIMKGTHTIRPFQAVYQSLKPYIVRKLLAGNASLRLLDFYKLGQLIGYMNKG